MDINRTQHTRTTDLLGSRLASGESLRDFLRRREQEERAAQAGHSVRVPDRLSR